MKGWGHVITAPDYWKTLRGMVETNWSWFGANADQGLLYYWTKYVKKSVSIIIKADVQQWDSSTWDVDTNGTLILRPRQDGDITTVVRNALKGYGCAQTQRLPSPYNDFYHMTGGAKPWYQSRKQLENPDCTTKKKKRECEIQGEWYQSLKEALISVNLLDGFPWDFLSGKPSDLGAAPYNGVSYLCYVSALCSILYSSKLIFLFVLCPLASPSVHEGKTKEKLDDVSRRYQLTGV